MNKKNYIIPIFIPHIGCPNDCSFCNQRKITGSTEEIDLKEVTEKIEEYLKSIPKNRSQIEIAFFGGSFTGIDENLQKKLLEIAKNYKESRKIDKIRLSTRPDYINIRIAEYLKKYKVDIVELGVQSMDNEILEKINRGHTRKDVIKASKIIKDNGIDLGVQVMVGLPGDNYEKFSKTVGELIDLKPTIARIYPVLVVKGTELEREYYNKEFIPLTVEESIKYSKFALYSFEKNDINVIRIGLQPTENIKEGGDIVAGPFHPSYRQLVESEMYFDIIDFKLKELEKRDLGNREVTIHCDRNKIDVIVGHKGVNKTKLLEKYNIRKLKIESSKLKIDTIVSIENKKIKINEKEILNKIFS